MHSVSVTEVQATRTVVCCADGTGLAGTWCERGVKKPRCGTAHDNSVTGSPAVLTAQADRVIWTVESAHGATAMLKACHSVAYQLFPQQL